MLILHLKKQIISRSSFFWTLLQKKPILAMTAACLLLVAFIIFLVISNFRSQMALREASLNRYRLYLEKRATSLGYFFSERKYDLKMLAHSREINNYFVNQALGMSVQYGLKVNLFMIKQLLKKTLAARNIQGTKIYSRFVLLDNAGNILVDTAEKPDPHFAVPRPDQGSPDFFFTFKDDQLQLLISTSCVYKNKVAGGLVVWLNDGALFSHFVNINKNNTLSGAGLLDDKGNMLLPDSADNEAITRQVLLKKRNNPDVFFEQHPIGRGNQEMLMACLPIPNVGLQYLVWIPTDQITGGLTPMRLFIGMAALAAVVLVALGSILWFSAQNLILKARFDEAAKQQTILFSKNQQLQAEIQKREQAEFELAKQRTLRIRSDRLRSLGEMAAGIAHELNQPLVGVRGFAELMIYGLDNEEDRSVDSIRDYAGKIVSQADRMVHIINHIRLFARDAGGVETSIVDLNETAHSALNLLQAQFHSHGLLLQQDYSPHPLWVKVNAFSVEEVILNLLSNARHAVEERRTTEDKSYHPYVCVSTSKHCESESPVAAVLVIDDNGNGIDKNVADKIFDPFFTTKAPDKGTGLGLSICKSIIESFEGTIEYICTADKWTRFEIRLPLCTKEG